MIIMTHHQSLVDSPLNQYRSELTLGHAWATKRHAWATSQSIH
jgi:hypothetical protein